MCVRSAACSSLVLGRVQRLGYWHMYGVSGDGLRAPSAKGKAIPALSELFLQWTPQLYTRDHLVSEGLWELGGGERVVLALGLGSGSIDNRPTVL